MKKSLFFSIFLTVFFVQAVAGTQRQGSTLPAEGTLPDHHHITNVSPQAGLKAAGKVLFRHSGFGDFSAGTVSKQRE
ncbi:MAG: hypothetical protein AB2L20_10585 [Mangrovibacterium sp.]